MNKTILIFSICIIVVFSAVALIGVLAGGNNATNNNEPEENVGMEDVITQKETALKIGRAILDEYSQIYWKRPFEDDLDAIEKDGIWTVYNVVERQGLTEDGKPWILFGGGVYVEISKSNGEIIKIGVND